MVELNGTELTIEQVMAVARHKEQVRISEPAKQKIDRARAYVDEKLAQKAVIYGLTTGFGKFSDTFVPEQETAALPAQPDHQPCLRHGCAAAVRGGARGDAAAL